jgi:hypothetical protein
MDETAMRGAVGASSLVVGLQIGMVVLCSLPGTAQAQLSFKTYQAHQETEWVNPMGNAA